jgi:hypothetical protein
MLKFSRKQAATRLPGVVVVVAALLAGCIQSQSSPPPPDMTAPPVAVTAPPSPTGIYPWRDANAVMSGICFEAAFDAAGQVYVLRNAEDHIRFYDLADHSQLCRHPVTRTPFDFSSGDVLAGLWRRGQGCSAHYDVLAFTRDDAAQTFTITLRFVTEGDCPYDLVSPFWAGLPGLADYDIHITVEGG